MSEDATPQVDPLAVLQNAIAQVADEGSLCTGFALVAEWIDADGSNSLQVFHSPMPVWHLHGLLSYAQETNCGPLVAVHELEFDDEDDDF
jgi:hypothetical protein